MEYTDSLITLLKNDPDFSGALQKRRESVKKDKQSLLEFSKLYNTDYQKEIEEGEKLRNRLLTEGKEKGLTEEQIFKGNKSFIPTVRTPILNFLYFMLRDEERCGEKKTIQESIEETLKQYGYEKTPEVQKYIDGIIQNFETEKTLDELGDSINFEDIINTSHDVPDIGEFLYGHLTIKEFNTVKKLKALSRSENPDEAARAFTKCMELCRRYNIEYDRIPCNIR